jgi:large-conductance mechanosensitive channel
MSFVITIKNNMGNLVNRVIWKDLVMIFNDFMNFIIENRLTSLLIIALMGIAISGLVTSLKTNIIEYYLNKLFKTSNNNFVMLFTALIQFIIIIVIIFFIYRYILKKIAEPFIQNKVQFDDISWKKNVLTELKTLNSNLSEHKVN